MNVSPRLPDFWAAVYQIAHQWEARCHKPGSGETALAERLSLGVVYVRNFGRIE